MAETYSEMLSENYGRMHSDELIELKIRGNLTPEAIQALDVEMERRKIGPDQISDHIERNNSSQKPNVNLGNNNTAVLASTSRRYFAQFIDQLVALFLTVLAGFLLEKLGMPNSLALIAYLGYILFNDSMPKGQSIGKSLLNIAVVSRITGRACNALESFLRNITTVVPILAIIDGIMILGKKKERLGDKLAKTIVIDISGI